MQAFAGWRVVIDKNCIKVVAANTASQKLIEDQHNLQLGRGVDVHDLITVLFDLLLGIFLRTALAAGENIIFGIIYIRISVGVDTELAFQTVKHGHGRKTPLR